MFDGILLSLGKISSVIADMEKDCCRVAGIKDQLNQKLHSINIGLNNVLFFSIVGEISHFVALNEGIAVNRTETGLQICFYSIELQ